MDYSKSGEAWGEFELFSLDLEKPICNIKIGKAQSCFCDVFLKAIR